VARVGCDGKTVDDRSVAEIERAIEALDREIAAAEGRRIVGRPAGRVTCRSSNGQHRMDDSLVFCRPVACGQACRGWLPDRRMIAVAGAGEAQIDAPIAIDITRARSVLSW
jgi:hypothetical protein